MKMGTNFVDKRKPVDPQKMKKMNTSALPTVVYSCFEEFVLYVSIDVLVDFNAPISHDRERAKNQSASWNIEFRPQPEFGERIRVSFWWIGKD